MQNKKTLGALLRTTLTAVTVGAALTAAPHAARAQQVYVGSGNGWTTLSAQPNQWSYVRQNADGFYINFIQLLRVNAATMSKLSAQMTHKNAYYESDSRYTGLGGFPDGGQFSLALQASELDALLQGGFAVPYTSLNYGLDAAKEDALKHQGLPAGKTRPCFTQCGPWTYGGDINSNVGPAAQIRANISKSDGASTDGPMSLWQSDQGKMQAGSYSLVKYVHGLHKTAAVMVAPYNLQPTSQWLSVAQTCVRQHENAGAKPNIWIVFEYATTTPTLPETVNGQPADTITGMAYWLIHHVKDPQHWARLSAPAGFATHTTHTQAGTEITQVALPTDNARGTCRADSNSRVFDLTLHNSSAWLDLCPVLSANALAPKHGWNVRYRVAGQDVTRQMVSKDGLAFINGLRLWPGQTKTVQVILSRTASAETTPPDVQISLRPGVSAKARVNQTLTLHSPSPQG
ncbi:MAG: hypothetical protein M3Y28_08415 [Armatimonadota bacterium]|nr:hypothetical protein [Armatimonadota bacterium]